MTGLQQISNLYILYDLINQSEKKVIRIEQLQAVPTTFYLFYRKNQNNLIASHYMCPHHLEMCLHKKYLNVKDVEGCKTFSTNQKIG
jgi:hypothetical protein